MSKALLLVPVLAACSQDVSYRPLPPSPTTAIAFAQLQVGAQPIIVATGGTQLVTIPAPLSVGWSATASDGFDVEPYAGIWPNGSLPQYRVRALEPGTGEFAIATSRGVASGAVASAEVARVAALPASYALDGHSAFALDPARPLVEIALYDALDRRLVDGSLAIAPATATSWDEVALDPTTPSHTLTVTADSMPAAGFVVELDGQIDRVEKVNEDNRLCYHAYHGATEIAAALPVLGTTDPSAINCQLSARDDE